MVNTVAAVSTPDLIFLDLSLPKVRPGSIEGDQDDNPVVVASGSEDTEHILWGNVVTLSPPPRDQGERTTATIQ